MRELAPARLDPPLVTVVFRASDTPSWSADATQEIAQNPDVDWDALQDLFPGLELKPLFDVDATVIEGLVARAKELTPGFRPAPFLSMFQVVLPPQARWGQHVPRDGREGLAATLREVLGRLLPVESVSVETVIAPPPLSDGSAAGTNSFKSAATRDQPHLDPSPKGMNAASAWAEPGGMGQTELLADVEKGWHAGHFEFNNPAADAIGFTLLPGGQLMESWIPHGTKVLSVAVARKNDDYGVGVAPLVPKVILSSEFRVATSGVSTEQAILDAIIELTAAGSVRGSVLLLEVQKNAKDVDPSIPNLVMGPCEAKTEIFNLIQLAVANHIVVVEAAGNSGIQSGLTYELDLDAHPTLAPEVMGSVLVNSGAILVGQSRWIEDHGHVKVEYGCVGNRIDCFAWGQNVYAASAEGSVLAPLDADTADFGGTSAAAAMIAGAALSVQGMVRAGAAGALGYLPPMQMRALLGDRTAGVHTPIKKSPVDDGEVTDEIGVMPDLKEVATRLGLVPDLYIRDHVGDNGDPHTGMISVSPDIIVLVNPLAAGVTPDSAFGAGSPGENSDSLSEDPVAGQPAEVFVRVTNRGGKDVTGAKVTVWWADSGALVLPPSWNKIGSALVDVPQGSILTVAGPIAWANAPVTGHYCFIAAVEHLEDELFVPATFAQPAALGVPGSLDAFEAYMRFIRTENNVSWRNFNVVPVPSSGSMKMAAKVSGPQDGGEREMELLIESRLPEGATLQVELPPELAGRMSLAHGQFKEDSRTGARRGRVRGVGVTSLGLALLAARELHEVSLHVKLPKDRPRRCEVALVQRHKGQVVGRVTWRLVHAAPT